MMRSNSSPPSTLQEREACNSVVLTGERGQRRNTDLLLHDQDEVMTGLKGSIQLDEVGVVQLVHHLDLIPDHLLRDANTIGITQR